MLTDSLIYTSDPGFILGFHGCDETVRDSIVNQKEMLKPSNDFVLRELDCSVIENVHSIMKALGKCPYDSARGVFVEGDPIYTNAGFSEKTHIQICIRNPSCIKAFFIPMDERIVYKALEF